MAGEESAISSPKHGKRIKNKKGKIKMGRASLVIVPAEKVNFQNQPV
jgi:hypothetical protein